MKTKCNHYIEIYSIVLCMTTTEMIQYLYSYLYLLIDIWHGALWVVPFCHVVTAALSIFFICSGSL